MEKPLTDRSSQSAQHIIDDTIVTSEHLALGHVSWRGACSFVRACSTALRTEGNDTLGGHKSATDDPLMRAKRNLGSESSLRDQPAARLCPGGLGATVPWRFRALLDFIGRTIGALGPHRSLFSPSKPKH
jgi:hypothetical protein